MMVTHWFRERTQTRSNPQWKPLRPKSCVPKWPFVFFIASVALLTAADQAWKDKQVREWTESDAQQLLTNCHL
jgi:hypothetical protein